MTFRLPRKTIFSKMGFKPETGKEHNEVLSQKPPFNSMVRVRADHAKSRMGALNFPPNHYETLTMDDFENPNILST